MKISLNTLKDRSLLLLYAIILLFIFMTIFFYIQARSNVVAETIRRKGSLLTLFIIHDEGRPLITMAYIYNEETHRGAVFAVPTNFVIINNDRSKFVPISSYFNPKNPQEYAQKVKTLLTLPDTPFFISMDLSEFSFLVDLIGGIEAFVANNTRIVDDGEILMLPAGAIILDGAKTREYLLITQQTSSQSRQEELTRRFVGSFLQQVSRKSHTLANPLVIEQLHNKSVTNMNKDALLEFWLSLQRVDEENLIIQKITGTMRTIDNQQFLFPHYDGRLIKEMVAQTLLTLANPQETIINSWPRRIEIQNGTSVNGLAQRTAQIYESLGYNVVRTSNADTNDVDYTMVIDFSDNMEAAQRVGEIIRTNRIYSFNIPTGSDLDIMENVDIRIILGRDFDGRYTQELVN